MATPAGLILLWHGLLANIPAGWVLCNGSNGTPDLQSKFVKGTAAATNPGTTGGAATHSTTQHAARTHSDSVSNTHASMTHVGITIANHSTTTNDLQASPYSDPVGTSVTHTVPVEAAHLAQAHSVTATSAHSPRTHSTGDNVPVNYALAFIMKT